MTDTASSPATVTLALPDLEDTLRKIFERNGCSPTTASILAANCAAAEAAGSYSHGIFRIDGYVSTLRSGWVDGQAVPSVETPAPGYVHVDAKNGFAQCALAAARETFVSRVRSQGIAFLAIRDSHHFAALWPDVTPFADEGLIALAMVNSMTCSIPAGAREPLFGTNPFAFAAPIEGGAPLVFDFATTSMAHGDVQIAAREGRQVPPGTGVDKDRNPTQDPKAILDGGSLIPFGAHKGSAISMMVELMVAGLSGGNFSFGFDWSSHPGAQTPRTGQILIAIDPGFSGQGLFASQARTFVEKLSEVGLNTYPGMRRWAKRGTTEVAIRESDHARLLAYADGSR